MGQNFNDVAGEPYLRYDVNMDGIVDLLDITTTPSITKTPFKLHHGQMLDINVTVDP